MTGTRSAGGGAPSARRARRTERLLSRDKRRVRPAPPPLHRRALGSAGRGDGSADPRREGVRQV